MAWLTIEPSPTLPSSRHISSRFSTHRATSLLHVPYSRISSPSLYRPLRTPAYPATQLSSQNRSPTTPPIPIFRAFAVHISTPANHPRIVLLRSLRFSTNIHICFSCTHQLLALLFQAPRAKSGSDRIGGPTDRPLAKQKPASRSEFPSVHTGKSPPPPSWSPFVSCFEPIRSRPPSLEGMPIRRGFPPSARHASTPFPPPLPTPSQNSEKENLSLQIVVFIRLSHRVETEI